jgi:CheY-like chemotaxis protein
VIEAATPGDAVRLTAGCAGQIDLLLTDVVMPLVNGVELARILRISKPGLKTLYMSGYAESVASEVEIGESASAQITKPFTAAALTRKVREVLGGGGGTRSSTSEHHG